MINGAPGTLDTLNEIAAAINDDANISTTLTNSITANTSLVHSSGNYLLGEVRANSASGTANASNITSNTSLVHSSGNYLLGEVRANSASGTQNASDILAVSGLTGGGGLPVASGAKITANTTLIHSSGNYLLGEVRANSVSGIAISGIAAYASGVFVDWSAASAGTIHATNYTDTVYTLPEATATTKGGIELFSDTDQSVAATAVSTTVSRTYGLQLNSDGQGVINVPWTDTDTNTTYSAATSSALGLMKLEDDTEQSVAANAVTATASRTYGVQFNSSDQAVVNVPWVDTNTTYSVGDGGLTTNDFTNDDHSKLNAIEASATADQTKADIDGLAITTVGTIDTGVWQGTKIASGYIADDAIDSQHYAAGSIDEAHLNVTNSPTDNYLLSYDSASAGFTWVAAAGGGSMSSFIITDGSTPQTVDDGETITFTDGVGAEFVTSATNTVTVNSVDSEIDHDSLSNFVANEHIDWTASSAGTIHASNYTDTTTNTMGSGFTVSATTDTTATTITQGDDLMFTAGTGITCETTADGTVTISCTVTDTNTQLSEEQVEDFVGGMLGGTETLITVTYQDGTGDIDFVVDNDLSNYDNSSSGFITATLTEEQVEDFVGGMLGGTETGIAVTYQDGTGDIDFVVSDTTVAGDSGSTGITPGDTLTIAGGTNVTTAMSGDTLTVTATDTNTMGSGFTVSATTDTNATTITQGDDLMFTAGTGITCETTADGTVTISCTVTDTNTQLTLIDSDTMTGASSSNVASAESVKAYVDTEITDLIGGAPGALDTLNELAAAINDDASYAATITTALGLKATLASPTFTGTIAIPNVANLETAVVANTAKATNVSTNLGVTTSETTVIVTSSDGDNATIPVATTSVGGVMSKVLFDKLDAIEASADITDTANVTSAGALMDSEVTNLAFVKALAKGISDGNVLTANDVVADDDFLRINGTEVEGLTVAEVLTALNVEAAADVTDTTNVTAAGALMDSEVTNLATVKALATGISDGNFLTANDAVADNDFLRIDGTEVEGRTASEVLSDIAAAPAAGSSNIVTVGTVGTGTWQGTAIATAYIADDAVTGAKIALFDDSLAATTTHFLIADGTDYSSFALSGDVTCTNAGVVSIADDVISSAELADACTAVTSFTAPLIEGSTSVQTPLIEYTDGDDAITIHDGGSISMAKAVYHPIANAAAEPEDATVNIDLRNANYFDVELGANVTDIDFTYGKIGQRFMIRFEQDVSSGPYTIAWNAVTMDFDPSGGSPVAVTISWPGGTAPTMTATDDKADTYGFVIRAEGHMDAFVIGQDMPVNDNS